MNAIAPPDLPDAEARARHLRDPLLAELADAAPGGAPRSPDRQVDTARRAPRARLRRRATLAAVAALTVAVALSATLATRPPDAALAVEHEDGWLVLRIADVSAGAEKLTQELREAGIRGEVRLLPVRAEEVGAWSIIAEHADEPVAPPRPRIPGPGETPDPPETVRLDRIDGDRETLRIPIAEVRESTGYFIFYAGRTAQPGEELLRDGALDYAP